MAPCAWQAALRLQGGADLHQRLDRGQGRRGQRGGMAGADRAGRWSDGRRGGTGPALPGLRRPSAELQGAGPAVQRADGAGAGGRRPAPGPDRAIGPARLRCALCRGAARALRHAAAHRTRRRGPGAATASRQTDLRGVRRRLLAGRCRHPGGLERAAADVRSSIPARAGSPTSPTKPASSAARVPANVADLEAVARDGVRVPLTVLTPARRPAGGPLLLRAYGSYGISQLLAARPIKSSLAEGGRPMRSTMCGAAAANTGTRGGWPARGR